MTTTSPLVDRKTAPNEREETPEREGGMAISFHPIDPGFDALGAGIASGINNFVRGRNAAIQQRLALGRQQLADSIFLAQHGGGWGSPPTELFRPRSGSSAPAAVSPSGIVMPQVTAGVQRTKPGYFQLTVDGKPAFMETPAHQAAREADAAFNRKMAEDEAIYDVGQPTPMSQKCCSPAATYRSNVAALRTDREDRISVQP